MCNAQGRDIYQGPKRWTHKRRGHNRDSLKQTKNQNSLEGATKLF